MTGRKILFFIILFSAFAVQARAIGVSDTLNTKKDSAWVSKGIFNITFGQTSFSNWSAGGQESVNGNFLFNYSVQYKKDNINWENNFEIAYGGVFEDRLRVYKKTNDKINMSTKYGYKASEKWNYSYLIDLKTQMANGYKYPNDSVPISRFMAPGYLHAGLGMDYFPFKGFSILLSPLTYKLTIVNDEQLANQGAFGVNPAEYDTQGNLLQAAKRFKNEPGGYIKLMYEHAIKDNFSVKSKLDLFSSFVNNPENLDVNWNTLVSYKITKYIATTLSVDIIYDEDAKIMEEIDGVKVEVGPRTQVKEIFSFGLSFKL